MNPKEIPFCDFRHYTAGLGSKVDVLPGQQYNPMTGTLKIVSTVAVSFPGELEIAYRRGDESIQEILGVMRGESLVRIVLFSPERQIQTATFDLKRVLMSVDIISILLPTSRRAGYPHGSSIYLN